MPMPTIRCPHCGSPVMIRGSRWECGWCGDFGSISSLHPSEKAKLMQAAAPSVQVTITVTGAEDGPDEENSPRSFSRAELEDMVHRWDFDENEWACRDLLLAAFPDAVRRWSPEEQQDMLTVDVLLGVSEYDPHTAIRMMQLLLDTAEEQLTKKGVAEQLFSWDLRDLLIKDDRRRWRIGFRMEVLGDRNSRIFLLGVAISQSQRPLAPSRRRFFVDSKFEIHIGKNPDSIFQD